MTNLRSTPRPLSTLVSIFALSLLASIAMAAAPAAGQAAPQLSFEPQSYDFGLQPVNRGSDQGYLQIRNNGPIGIGIDGLGISGPDSGNFWTGYSDCYGAWLEPNETCGTQVSFGPNEVRSYSAQLNAYASDGSTPTAELSGAGGQAFVTASPNSADFGSAAADSIGAVRTITLTNRGNLPAGFFIAAIAGGDVGSFRLLDENCTGLPLDVATSCTVRVRFEPTGEGAKRARLSLFGDGDGAEIGLTGVGTAPVVPVAPATTSDSSPTGARRDTSPRVTFRWNGIRPRLRARKRSRAAGAVTCHAARSCRLDAQPIVVTGVFENGRRHWLSVPLRRIHLRIGAGVTKQVDPYLTRRARKLLTGRQARVVLRLSWTADDRAGNSWARAPIR